MSNLEMNYSNERAYIANEANHYNGRDGYHEHTRTYYKDGKPVWSHSTANDRYTSYPAYTRNEYDRY